MVCNIRPSVEKTIMEIKPNEISVNDTVNFDDLTTLRGDGNAFSRQFVDRRAPLRIPLISQLPVAAFCCDIQGAVVSHNEAAAEIWGRVPNPSEIGQWSGAHAMFDLDGHCLARKDYPSAQAVAAGRNLDAVEMWLERPDGTRRRIESHPKLARGSGGVVAGALCVLVDNTERQRLADELQRADDDRSAFLSLLAHELRNPLSPILSAAAVMKRVSTDAQIVKMANVVERQVKLLSRFVGDLLDASNLAENGISLRIKPVLLSKVVDTALDALSEKAESRAQHIGVNFEARDKTVVCDPERVSQALANVLLNASEFTDNGGSIALRIKVDGALMEAEVEDSGIGIAPEQIAMIFRPYTQFATHKDRLRAGAGLGLAIAKDICEKHGGLITATSDGTGQGSRFRLILPIVCAQD
ncbi:PAS domain-containing sensor histidine kinase [Massilia scottii]|uniref:PAS domain-containing sensor histidine kinase n=2 Tax=Massilia TaxID=149698 RepID=UPI0027966AFD|nr:PAS domain-containing sensor histidine kinase [Massilia sp. CCM 9029]MDQ1835466.1 ATP-binding protein [Massilia sp. CCM 9029]